MPVCASFPTAPPMPLPTKRLLQLGPLPPGLQNRLDASYRCHPLWTEKAPEDFLLTAEPFDGAVTMSRHGCTDYVMQALANGIVACFGVGTERLDLDAARRHLVSVTNTPDVLTECVADLAWGLLIATARRIPQSDAFTRAGNWTIGGFGLTRRVHGKRLGIVGMGRIGRAILARAAGFGMQVRYHGTSAKPDLDGFEPSLRALAAWADFLVLACNGGPSTHHLVNADVLGALGPAGILVNISRGSVVDEAALVQALTSGQLGGAGLDVFEREPQVPPVLLTNDRVVLLPHVGAGTHETREDMEDLVCANLEAFFAGRALPTPVLS